MNAWVRIALRAGFTTFCALVVALSLPVNTLAVASQPKATEVHEQGDKVEVHWKKVKSCVFRIRESRWSDQIGMPNIPGQFQTEQTRVKAHAALLVVDASIVNRGDAAVRTGGFDVAPLVFRLTSERGQLFAPMEHAALQQDNLSTKLWIGADVNPESALTGTIVFDVPKGDYVLVTYNSKMDGNSFQPRKELFRYKLTPADPLQAAQ